MNAAGCAGGSASGGKPFTSILTIGSSGEAVTLLQLYLAQSKLIYPEGSITGQYGSATADAVKRFQKKNGLPQTGILDLAPQNIANLFYDAIP